MKKTLIVLSIAITLISCSSNQISDKERYGLKGNVKSIKEIIYYAETSFGKTTPSYPVHYTQILPNDISKEIIFDKNGNRLIYNEFEKENILLSKYIYYYNEKLQLIAMNRYDKHGNLLFVDSCWYDNDNVLVITTRYDEAGKMIFKESIIRTTDENFKINDSIKIRMRWVIQNNEDIEIGYHEIRKDNNLIIEEILIFIGSDLYEKFNYKYDSNSWIIEQKLEDLKDDRYGGTCYYRYDNLDEKGNWTQKLIYEQVKGDSKPIEPTYIAIREIEYFDK